MDAVELTLLLKSLGCRLEFMDYDTGKVVPNSVPELSIQITCNNSGITSKMSYKPKKCTCPPQGANNNSFWEVQGTAPAVSQCVLKDISFEETSSNLLPDISKNMTMATRCLVSGLMEAFDSEIAETKVEQNGTKSTVRVEE